MLGHRAMGACLTLMGDFVRARAHQDQVISLYDPVEYRHLSKNFSQDPRVITFLYRSWALWALGYPEAAIASADQALSAARGTGLAGLLMQTMSITMGVHVICGNYAIGKAQSDEIIALAEEKGSIFWKAVGMLGRASVLANTGRASEAVAISTSVIGAYRSTGATLFLPPVLSHRARACAELGQFDEAWSYIDEAITMVETTKEKLAEVEVHRIAGEIALMSPKPDVAKAEAYFERALAVARAQQAKSWELRAATSMARLWREQGKRDEARDLLAPVYGWFTEGFDTLDLKQAKALLDELAA
jgi:predicted ATPase